MKGRDRLRMGQALSACHLAIIRSKAIASERLSHVTAGMTLTKLLSNSSFTDGS